MIDFIRKASFCVIILCIFICLEGIFNVISAETAKKNLSEADNKAFYKPEITGANILSADKSGCNLEAALFVSYEGEDLGSKVKTTILLVAGSGAFYDTTDGKVIKKGKKQYEVKFSYKSGKNISCSGMVKFITTVEDQHGNVSNSYAVEANFSSNE